MMQPHYFIHIASGRSWPTEDPHHWLLDHRDGDLLAPARERLVLSPDPERCLRAVLRRCGLALVRAVNKEHLVVRHWSGPTPDLRGWAKDTGWNRRGVQVVFVQEKTGKAIVHEDGQVVLMYGEPVGSTFPWGVYETKYERRLAKERDDHEAASASVTNFKWANCPNETINWSSLKAVWNSERVECPNCNQPLMLVGFDWRMGLLSFRSARIVRHCLLCRRWFVVNEENPLAWLAKVLPPNVRPTHVRLWAAIPINWSVLSLGVGRPVQLADGERS